MKSFFDLIWVFWLRRFNDLQSCAPNFDLFPSSAVNLWGNLHLILRSPKCTTIFFQSFPNVPVFTQHQSLFSTIPTTFSQNSLQHFAPPWSNFPPTSNMFSDFPTAEALHWRHQFLKESTDQKTWCAKQFQKVMFSYTVEHFSLKQPGRNCQITLKWMREDGQKLQSKSKKILKVFSL